MAGKCTRIEDVFPIEHGDLPASYVSLLEITFEGCFLLSRFEGIFLLEMSMGHFWVLFFLGVVGRGIGTQVPNIFPKKNPHGSGTEICTAVGPNFVRSFFKKKHAPMSSALTMLTSRFSCPSLCNRAQQDGLPSRKPNIAPENRPS